MLKRKAFCKNVLRIGYVAIYNIYHSRNSCILLLLTLVGQVELGFDILCLEAIDFDFSMDEEINGNKTRMRINIESKDFGFDVKRIQAALHFQVENSIIFVLKRDRFDFSDAYRNHVIPTCYCFRNCIFQVVQISNNFFYFKLCLFFVLNIFCRKKREYSSQPIRKLVALCNLSYCKNNSYV